MDEYQPKGKRFYSKTDENRLLTYLPRQGVLLSIYKEFDGSQIVRNGDGEGKRLKLNRKAKVRISKQKRIEWLRTFLILIIVSTILIGLSQFIDIHIRQRVDPLPHPSYTWKADIWKVWSLINLIGIIGIWNLKKWGFIIFALLNSTLLIYYSWIITLAFWPFLTTLWACGFIGFCIAVFLVWSVWEHMVWVGFRNRI